MIKKWVDEGGEYVFYIKTFYGYEKIAELDRHYGHWLFKSDFMNIEGESFYADTLEGAKEYVEIKTGYCEGKELDVVKLSELKDDEKIIDIDLEVYDVDHIRDRLKYFKNKGTEFYINIWQDKTVDIFN